jgi:hypothetical protein
LDGEENRLIKLKINLLRLLRRFAPRNEGNSQWHPAGLRSEEGRPEKSLRTRPKAGVAIVLNAQKFV